MKVFFRKSEKRTTKTVLTFLSVVLALGVFISQWFVLSEKNSRSVSARADMNTQISDVVVLHATQPLKKGDAYVYLNGDEYAPFEGTECSVNVYANGVVEILSFCDASFDVSFETDEVNLKSVPDFGKIRCNKGINYICRMIYSGS